MFGSDGCAKNTCPRERGAWHPKKPTDIGAERISKIKSATQNVKRYRNGAVCERHLVRGQMPRSR